MQNTAQKICLVTGANSGVGKEIALALVAAGAHVIMVCRHAERGQAALAEIQSRTGSTAVDLLIADLSSQADIHVLSQVLHERYDRIEVLINNAGLVSKKKMLSRDGIEMTLATNHLAPFLLTQCVLDLLQKGAPSRVINISSAIHKWASLDLNDLEYHQRRYQFMKAYAQSKLLLNITSFEWARQLDGTGITVNCVHPGAVKTALGSQSADSKLLQYVDKAIKFFFLSPEVAAKTPVHLALSADMENVTGNYYVKGKAVPASAASYDKTLAQAVWKKSLAYLKRK